MRNDQLPGMQRDARRKRRPAAIFPIAQDRMAVMGQLQADLVFSARFQLHFQPGKIDRRAWNVRKDQSPVGKPCFLGVRHGRSDDVHSAMPFVLAEPIHQPVGGRFDRALDQRPITLFDVPARNCSVSLAAAFDVRASSTTPVTGASSRLTMPK